MNHELPSQIQSVCDWELFEPLLLQSNLEKNFRQCASHSRSLLSSIDLFIYTARLRGPQLLINLFQRLAVSIEIGILDLPKYGKKN